MMRRALGGLLGLVLLGCGDDAGGTGGSDSSDGTSTGSTTLPLTITGSTNPNPTGSTGSTGPTGSSTADETGMPPDMPPPQEDDCERLDMLVEALPQAADPEGMVDEFVRETTYGAHGFPITCDGTLAVVHLGGPGLALSVAGDFNDWTAGEFPLVEPVDGLGFYYALVQLPDAPEGLYKLVEDDDVFFADPLARRFGWDRFGEYSQVDAMPDRSHHERWPAFDQAVGALQPRTVTVYLPAGALAESGLPVLYMHDGQNLFSPDALFGGWRITETLDVAIGDGTLAPMVVVGIDNTFDRFDEYTHTADDLGGGNEVGGRADEYADFLVDGIKPFVEGRYPVSDDPSLVATMGSSLGGLVSLYIGRRHPDVFGHVASMSGTIAWGTIGLANPTIVDLYLDMAPTGLQIYLDSGGDAGPGCPDGGFDNYCGNVQLADALRGLGWVDESDLFYRWEPGAPHNELAWANRFLPALVDWFPVAG